MIAEVPALLNLVEALGIGLLIGAERERRNSGRANRTAAGIRTFAIASMAGAVSVLVGGDVLLVATLIGIFGLAGLSYARSKTDEIGLTTELALALTVLLGGLSIRKPEMAAGIAVVVTILLAARAPIHQFIRSAVTEDELRDALIVAAATLVVLPVLPAQPMGPYAAVSPRAIWTVVVLVMAIAFFGHVATRLMGTRYGLPLSGLASGFVSSTLTIRDMGERAARVPGVVALAAAGASLSSVSTIIQLAMVLAATSITTLSAVLFPIAAAGLASAIYGLAMTRAAVQETADGDHGETRQTTLNISTAALFAVTLALVLVVSAAMQDLLGTTGILLTSFLAGLVNTQSATIAIALLVATGKLSAAEAVAPILIAMTANVLFRIMVAFKSGSRAFAQRVVPGLILTAFAAWLGAWLSTSFGSPTVPAGAP